MLPFWRQKAMVHRMNQLWIRQHLVRQRLQQLNIIKKELSAILIKYLGIDWKDGKGTNKLIYIFENFVRLNEKSSYSLYWKYRIILYWWNYYLLLVLIHSLKCKLYFLLKLSIVLESFIGQRNYRSIIDLFNQNIFYWSD